MARTVGLTARGSEPSGGAGRGGVSSRTVGVVAVAVALIIAIVVLAGAFTRTDPGQVAVIRNGGWFDDTSVRQMIPPASPLTWIGLYSTEHDYPATQRYFEITDNPVGGQRSGVDVVFTPSKDGVNMGIQGTFYFSLNSDPAVLADFDNRFGTRTFTGADGTQASAWDGDTGWNAFLDQAVRPVIEQTLRQQIGNFRCADLVSSCALVQNSVAGTTAPTASPNNQNIAAIQQAVNAQFAQDLSQTLGGPLLVGTQFNLSKVSLPEQVQAAVDAAQAAFAGVSQSQARVAQAQADAQANEVRQRGYTTCPVCGQIDIIRSLPPGVTTYAPGAGAAVPLGR